MNLFVYLSTIYVCIALKRFGLPIPYTVLSVRLSKKCQLSKKCSDVISHLSNKLYILLVYTKLKTIPIS